jgi:CheY-like chemotaxis protein
MNSKAPHQIVVLEDDPRRIARMRELLRQESGLEAQFFEDVFEICTWLDQSDEVELISLDCDLPCSSSSKLGTDDGVTVANRLAASATPIPVIVHSSNAAGAESMYWSLKRAGCTVSRVSPFGDLDWIEQAWIHEVKELLHLL